MERKHNAWMITGILHNVRTEAMAEEWGEDIESLKVFRVGQDFEAKENLSSPLKDVSAPTLMEVKELPSDYLQEMRSQLAVLIESKLIVDSAECINRLGQFSSRTLVELMGKKLQNVPEDVKQMLLGGSGPFSGRRTQKKRTCGTYLELMQHHLRNPNPTFAQYLRKVEEHVIEKFGHIDGFPGQPEILRNMFHDFVSKGRVLRDAHSHIALLSQDKKEAALLQVEKNLAVLKTCGLDLVEPLVIAGMYIIRHGIECSIEDEAVEEEPNEEIQSTSLGEGHRVPPLKKTSVKVTFVAKMKLKLGFAPCIFGYHPLLGRGLPDRAIQMSSADGYNWSKVFKLPIGENIQYSFVIMKKEKTNKWVMTDGPFGDFTVHVRAPAMTVQTNLEDYMDGKD